MMILFHVSVALGSMLFTTLMAFWPSLIKLRISYGLIALTLATGTYLVVSLHTPLLSACMSGLFYLGVALTGVGVAHYRLAGAKQTAQN